jgi:hypothetical protein
VKGRLSLGEDWFIAYYGDIGGFGLSSDLTCQDPGSPLAAVAW